jgi:hypothetical protein
VSSWAVDIHKYVKDYELPEDNVQAKCVAQQAKMYVLVDGGLYRRREN